MNASNDNHDEREPLFHCEGCEAPIMDGDRYHSALDIELCAKCAPSYRDLIESPFSFSTYDGDQAKAKDLIRAYNLHISAGGSPDDKILNGGGNG